MDKDFLDALKSTPEVELAVSKSSKWTTRPVWFVVDGSTIFLLPVNGTDTKWYKYAIVNPQIELLVRGKKTRGEARPVSDPQKLTDVIARFRMKYGDLEKYYRKLDVAIAVTI